MKYVDAGYIICMGSLFVYAVSLIVRRSRLERAVAVAARDQQAEKPVVGLTDGADGADGAETADSVTHPVVVVGPVEIDPALAGGRGR